MDIIDQIKPAIVAVLIEIEGPNGKRDLRLNGTGFFVTSNGYILTCYHVIRPPGLSPNSKVTSIKVETQRGPFEASLESDKSRSEKHLDWAVLKVNEDIEFPCLSLFAEYNQGDQWCSIGYERAERAKGYPLMGTIIGPYERKEEASWDIDLNSINPIQGGVSGSPVFNKKTDSVAGLIKEVFEGTQVFATSIKSVFEAWPELEKLNLDSPTIIQPPKSGIKMIHQIPNVPQDFTGRDEELGKLIDQFNQGKVIVGIRGLGGTGKTALAFKLAEKLKDRYPDGQLMINLQGTGPNPLSPVDAMGQVIRSFDPTASLPESESETANMYSSILSDKRVLLLLDNALDDKQVRPLLPPSTCGLILTSRKKFTVPGMKEMMNLDVLKPWEARDLLLTICERIGDQADELARLCGYLPLALRAAGSFMANTDDLKPAEYIDELRSERTRLERLGSEGVDLDVASSFNLSYSRLPIGSKRIFYMISIFPADFDAYAEEAICQDEGHKVLSELVKWSLIDYRSMDGSRRYRMHDLVKAFASGWLDKEDGEVKRFEVSLRFAEYYRDLLGYANSLYQEGGEDILAGLRLFDLEQLNIRAGQDWAEEEAENIEDHPDISELSPENESVLRLCSSYFIAGLYVLSLRLHPQEQIQWLENALDASRRLNDRKYEGYALGNLGNAYYRLGDYQKAIEYYEQSLAIATEIGDRLVEGQSLCGLGNAYHSLGDYQKAIEYHEQSLAIATEIGDRLGEGQSLGNLGNAYYSLGDYQKAIEYHEQSLAIATEIGDRLGEGAALGNLGIAYHSLGDYQKAIEYQEQSLAIATEIGDRLVEGQSLGSLGNAYHSLGDYQKAIEYQEQSLAIATEIGDRLGEGNAMFNMSLALNETREREQAIGYAKSALQIFDQIESPYAEEVRQQLKEWQG